MEAVSNTALLDAPRANANGTGRSYMLNQSKLFTSVAFRPHRGQAEIFSQARRFDVAVCGRRFGKSEIGGHRLLTEAFVTLPMQRQLTEDRKRREFWIVGPNYTDSEKEFRVLYNQLKKLGVPFDKPGTYNDPQGGNMHISLWEGAYQVAAKSAAHPDSLVGEGNSGVVMAEAAKIKEKVWLKAIRPTLNDFKGWAEFTTTPEGKNWIYDLWQRGQDPRFKSWSSHRMPSWRNPYVYPLGATKEGIAELRAMLKINQMVDDEVAIAHGVDPEIAQLLMDLTDASFDQEIAAEFSDFVGRVFQDFDEETHVGDLTFNPEWQTFAAVDYGYTNPNVWLLVQVDPFGELINVLGEVYERGLGPDQFADRIVEKGLAPSSLQAFYPDPASPGDTNVLTRRLRVQSRAGTGGELKYRLDAIRKGLKPFPLGVPGARPRIMFDRSCVESIRDFSDYRYPDTKTEQDKNAPENPMKVDDHAPEAFGRFMAGHFGTAEIRQARARSTQAVMRRR